MVSRKKRTGEEYRPLSVLFIADGSLERPLLHSQGLPLLRWLRRKGRWCSVLSFESKLPEANNALRCALESEGIVWLPLVIRGGASSWRQRLQMICGGIGAAINLCRRRAVDVVHCRSYRPAIVGGILKTLLGCGFIFDMRGFLIDEQVLAGRWRPGTIKYRLGRWAERWALLRADAVVTTSPQFRERVLNLPYFPSSRAAQVVSIPNCVDVQRYRLLPGEQRLAFRSSQGWTDRLVVVFSGEGRPWDDIARVVSFFSAVKQVQPHAYLLLLIHGQPAKVLKQVEAMLGMQDYCLLSVEPTQMPMYLGAADIGTLFLKRDALTQAIASPIKFAEYLACGLPVALNGGIGDTERIVRQYRVGVVVDADPTAERYSAEQLVHWLQTDSGLQQRCRLAAENELSLDYACGLYEQLYYRVKMQR